MVDLWHVPTFLKMLKMRDWKMMLGKKGVGMKLDRETEGISIEFLGAITVGKKTDSRKFQILTNFTEI